MRNLDIDAEDYEDKIIEEVLDGRTGKMYIEEEDKTESIKSVENTDDEGTSIGDENEILGNDLNDKISLGGDIRKEAEALENILMEGVSDEGITAEKVRPLSGKQARQMRSARIRAAREEEEKKKEEEEKDVEIVDYIKYTSQ